MALHQETQSLHGDPYSKLVHKLILLNIRLLKYQELESS